MSFDTANIGGSIGTNFAGIPFANTLKGMLGEFFNVFNIANLSGYSLTCGIAGFDQPTQRASQSSAPADQGRSK